MGQLESKWKSCETTMLAEMRQQEVEMHLRREEEKLRLKQLEAKNEVEAAPAQVRAYKYLEDGLRNHEEESDPPEIHAVQQKMESKESLNLKAVPFQPQQTFPEITSQDSRPSSSYCMLFKCKPTVSPRTDNILW